jgi:PKD repeat protein
MQNRIIVLTIILMVISFKRLSAQCDNLSISMPDTVCAGDVFLATNTSSVSGNVEWNTCFGDLSQPALNLSIQNVSSLLNQPCQVRMVKNNGNYYLFIINLAGQRLVRWDYGTSLTNTPTAYDYGNLGGALVFPYGIETIEENGVWYAIITSFVANTLVRVNFGSDISANSATATNIGSPGPITATRLELVEHNDSLYFFAFGNFVYRFDFGTSILNSPSSVVGMPPTMASVQAYDMKYDCKLDKHFASFTNGGAGRIWVADFGNSPGNIPTFPIEITQANGNGLSILRNGGDWHILSTTNGVGGKVYNYKFGSNLLNSPQIIYADTMANLIDVTNLELYEDSSYVYGFAASFSPMSINRFRFTNPCLNGSGFSNDPSTVQLTAGTGGYEYIDLKITDASGEVFLYTDSVFVSPTPVSLFSTGPACENSPVSFFDNSTVPAGAVTQWEWDFGDGSPASNIQNPTHTFPALGNFNVTLTTQSGPNCPSNTVVQNVTISSNPVAGLTLPAQSCQGYSVNLDDNSTAPGGTFNTSWFWTFSDDNTTDTLESTTHVFDSVGVFNVSLTVTNNAGCKDSLTESINIDPTPVPSFSTTSTCVGEAAEFTNSTSLQGGGNLTYLWNFGDSGTSLSENPTHQYSLTAANYDVSLIATSGQGCNDTIIQNIRIGNQPNVQFSWSPQIVCQGNQITFSNASTGSGTDTISSYFWDFGDTNTSLLENPTHVYADTGYYYVTLTAISPTYCDSSITLQVYVTPGPEITFSAAAVCLTNSTSFNPVVVTPPGTTVDSVVWDFGDGTTFNGLSSPVHTYAAPGDYLVTATVYNDLLCTSTFIDTVVVHPLPVADFSTTLPCSGDTITFDGTLSQVVGNNITSWIWDFNGLATSTDSTPDFTFANPGNYNVTLIVNTSFGCSDTIQNQISVIQSPDFTIAFADPCLGDGAGFTYLSNITPTPPSNLVWNFGDGTISTALNPTHLFSNFGSYPVSLTVTNPNTGCSSTINSAINVNPIPNAGFSANNNCQNLPLTLTDTSTVSTGTIASWNWDFGVLGTSILQNPSFISANSGIFPVTLTVTTNEGCSNSFSSTAEVYPNPEADFITNPIFGSPPLNVNFINNTTGAINWFWDFGDGNTSLLQAPVHIYPDTGLYQITLIATSNNGCSDTTFGNISVLIPYLDLAVINVYATVDQGKVSLIARLANTGNITITETDIRGIIQGSRPVNETRNGSLLPGQVEMYQFVSSIEMDKSYIPEFFCVEILDVNGQKDMNQENDKLCGTLTTDLMIFSAFPQPFTEQLNLSFNLPEAGLFSLSMYDIAGRLVKSETSSTGTAGYNQYQINTNGLAKGVYVLSIRSGDDIRSMKVIRY